MTLALPSAEVAVRGGGLQPGAVGVETPLVVGCCADGPTDVARLVSSIQALVSIYKTGPAVKAAAYMNAKVNRPFVFVRVLPTPVLATTSAVVKTGTGTFVPTITGTPNNASEVQVVFTAGGTIGTVGIFYKYSLDGGRTFTTPAALGTATTIALTGTGLTVNLTATQTVVTNDSFTFHTTAASPSILPLTMKRAGSSTSVVTATGSPEDVYQVVVEVLIGGTVGVLGIVLRYSLDGGRTFTPARQLGSSDALDLVDDTATGTIQSGVTVEFGAGTLDAGDVITFNTTGPQWQVSDVLAAIRIAKAGQNPWRWVHVVGDCSVADAGSIAAEVDSYASSGVYVWSLIEARDQGPNEERAVFTDRLTSAVAHYVAPYQGYCAGYAYRITCPITGRQNRRPCAWMLAPWLLKFGIDIDPAQKTSGALYADVALHDDDGNLAEYDANDDVSLHGARYITLRQYPGEAGVFFTRGNTMEAEGGSFNRLPYVRISLLAAGVQRIAEQQLLEQGISVQRATDPKPGTIFEGDAINFETEIRGALVRALDKKVTSIKVVVDRDTPLSLTGGKPKVKAFVQPFVYVDFVEGEFVLVDPGAIPVGA